MKSRIFWGQVWHRRLLPVSHSFSYPVFSMALHVDELEHGLLRTPVFGYNRPAVFSVYAKDYLPGGGTIREKLNALLAGKGLSETARDIYLLTVPRYFGYVFNPVSFYLCFTAAGLEAVVAEVHNTFAEGHLYTLMAEKGAEQPLPSTYCFPKQFFVSPFFDVSGAYELCVGQFGQSLDLRIQLVREQQVVFQASLTGAAQDFSNGNLWRTMRRYPFAPLCTMPRIHYEAYRLLRGRKASLHPKPAPSDNGTYVLRPRLFDRVRLALLRRLCLHATGLGRGAANHHSGHGDTSDGTAV